MRAALYARYSTNNQRVESIDAQLRAEREYCKRKGYTVVGVYVDEAVSGKTDNREDFQRMVKDAEARCFDVVIFHKIDRNARNEINYFAYKDQFTRSNVAWEYVEQNIDDSPEGAMMETMLVGMSAYYSRNLAREVMKGMKENAYQAKFNGGIPPLGYDVKDGKLIINEYEAQAVQLIFNMKAQGFGYSPIISELHAKGYRTKTYTNAKGITKGGRPFGKNSLFDILKNKRYIGIYAFNRVKRKNGRRNSHSHSTEIIEIENAHPAIIDIDTWNRVQARMEQDKKATGKYSAKRIYPLSGLIYCECGSVMVGFSTKARGKEYVYYRCRSQQYQLSNCPSPRIRAEDIERDVMEDVEAELSNPEKLAKMIDEYNWQQATEANNYNDSLQSFEKQKADITVRINNLLDTIESGQGDDIIKARYNQQLERLVGIDAEMKRLKQDHTANYISIQQVQDNINKWTHKDKSPEFIRAMFETFVDRVTIRGDKAFIELSFLSLYR